MWNTHVHTATVCISYLCHRARWFGEFVTRICWVRDKNVSPEAMYCLCKLKLRIQIWNTDTHNATLYFISFWPPTTTCSISNVKYSCARCRYVFHIYATVPENSLSSWRVQWCIEFVARSTMHWVRGTNGRLCECVACANMKYSYTKFHCVFCICATVCNVVRIRVEYLVCVCGSVSGVWVFNTCVC